MPVIGQLKTPARFDLVNSSSRHVAAYAATSYFAKRVQAWQRGLALTN